MKVKIDREECIGCGFCANACPKIFQLDEEEKAAVVKQPDKSEEKCASEAAEGCPAAAISVE